MQSKFEEVRSFRRRKQKDVVCQFDENGNQYSVHELSAQGFSFLCQKQRCSFHKWQDFNRIAISNAEGVEILNGSGTIAHVTDYDSQLMLVGVFYNRKFLDRTITGRVRVPRKYPRTPLSATLRFSKNEPFSEVEGHIIDYTASTARIGIQDQHLVKAQIGDIINISVYAADKKLLDEEALVVRKKDDGTEVIVNFKEGLLDVDYVETISSAIENQKNILSISSAMSAFEHIPETYKAVLNDFRMYLKRVKTALDQLDAQKIYQAPWEKELFIKEIEGGFINTFNFYLGEFNKIADTISEDEKLPYKKYFRENINYYVHASPIGASMIDKDHGYSGDYETIKQFFENPYAGDSLYSKLMSKCICSTGAVSAHQERIDYIYGELVSHYHSCRDKFSFLSLGSGPAEEVLRLIANHTFEKEVFATLLDMDSFALADFSDRLQYLPKENFVVDLVNINIINLLRQKGDKKIINSYDVTYCAGLFDYINDKICKRLISYLIGVTKPNGFVIVTNVNDNNFHKNVMDYGFEWEIIHRDRDGFRALAPADYPVKIFSDDTDTNLFMKISNPSG